MDLIERLTGLSPDGGNGTLEALYYAAFPFAVFAVWRLRRKAHEERVDRDRHRRGPVGAQERVGGEVGVALVGDAVREVRHVGQVGAGEDAEELVPDGH